MPHGPINKYKALVSLVTCGTDKGRGKYENTSRKPINALSPVYTPVSFYNLACLRYIYRELTWLISKAREAEGERAVILLSGFDYNFVLA